MTNNASTTQWQYLEKRPSSWRQQLYLKGKKLRAYNVWSDMIANDWSIEETAYNWDLPIEAVLEAVKYCQTNLELLQQEAEAEWRYLKDQGVNVEPKIVG